MEKSLRGKEILKYVGSHNQLFGTREYTLGGGRMAGVKAVEVRNGSGMQFTVILDRGMDIADLTFQGINFSYFSNVGIVSSPYYEKDGLEFLRTYSAGFLTTCGLTQAGIPNSDEGEELGLHGRISHVPAEEVYAGTDWQDDGPVISVCGKVKQAKFFGEHLVLDRKLTCIPGDNTIYIDDTVTNRGFRVQPLMILYHINLGYPLLDSSSYIIATSGGVIPQNEVTKSDLDNKSCHEPQKDYQERVYLHENLRSGADGTSSIALINEEIKKGIHIKFDKNQLDQLLQWKQLGEGEYVVGLEPSNCGVIGRHQAREKGVLKFIQPGETKPFNVKIEILEDMEKIKAAINNIKG